MIFRIYDSKRMDMYIQTIRQNQLARFRNVSWHVYIIYLFIPCRCRRGYIFTRYCRTLSNVSQIIWTGFFSIVNICITNTRNGSIFDNDIVMTSSINLLGYSGKICFMAWNPITYMPRFPDGGRIGITGCSKRLQSGFMTTANVYIDDAWIPSSVSFEMGVLNTEQNKGAT